MQWIELTAQPHDTLDWSREISCANEASAAGKKIFWKFNLGLEVPLFPLEDELRFQALRLALTQFSKEIWPSFQDATFGLCLYRGMAVTEEAFAIYFQMLSHRLPDEAKIFLLFDLSSFSAASEIFSALSKERFEHFTLGIRGKSLPREGYRWEGESLVYVPNNSSLGIVFPENPAAHPEFDRHLQNLPTAKVIFERYLYEEWEGLDQLYVLRNELTPQGERMLKGFAAAGGEVIFL